MRTRTLTPWITLCGACVWSAAAAGTAAPPPVLFADVTAASGLDFTYHNGATGELHLPEIMGPGAAFLDYDNDGDLDVFLVQGSALGPKGEPPAPRSSPPAPGERDRLFRNDLVVQRDGRRELHFSDVSDALGPTAAGYGLGVAAGDFDGDGYVDLYVLRYGGNRLLRNVEGRRFEDVTERAGVADPGWSDSATFFDYDRDGRLDLFVVHYVDYQPVRCVRASTRRDYCGPKSFRPRTSHLFHNRGDGRFEDVTRALMTPERAAPGLGVVSVDADADGWLDLYVANDGFDNLLWLNRQGRGFREDGLLAGVALNRAGQAEAGMGVDVGDSDGTGREDIFVANLSAETNTLYAALGDGLFEDRTLAAGLGPASLPHTGFGTRFLDYDNDGALDIVVVNGAVHLPEAAADDDPGALAQPKLLFRNQGQGTFADVSQQAGEAFTRREVSRGLAVGDVDNDGDPDLLVANNVGPSRLLLNQLGQEAPWLGLRLLTADGRRDALGALVTLRRRSATALVRRVHADGSYASSSDPRVLFGLASGTDVAEVEVRWPDGARERFPAPPLRAYTTLRQGRGAGIGGAP